MHTPSCTRARAHPDRLRAMDERLTAFEGLLSQPPPADGSDSKSQPAVDISALGTAIMCGPTPHEYRHTRACTHAHTLITMTPPPAALYAVATHKHTHEHTYSPRKANGILDKHLARSTVVPLTPLAKQVMCMGTCKSVLTRVCRRLH